MFNLQSNESTPKLLYILLTTVHVKQSIKEYEIIAGSTAQTTNNNKKLSQGHPKAIKPNNAHAQRHLSS